MGTLLFQFNSRQLQVSSSDIRYNLARDYFILRPKWHICIKFYFLWPALGDFHCVANFPFPFVCVCVFPLCILLLCLQEVISLLFYFILLFYFTFCSSHFAAAAIEIQYYLRGTFCLKLWPYHGIAIANTFTNVYTLTHTRTHPPRHTSHITSTQSTTANKR